jgi:hypothetical protein
MFTSGTDVTIRTAGVYLVSFYASVSGNATITRISPRINKIGVVTVASETNVINGVNGETVLSTVSNYAVNDTIAATVLFTGGSSYQISGNATNDNVSQTRLSVTWLGQST